MTPGIPVFLNPRAGTSSDVVNALRARFGAEVQLAVVEPANLRAAVERAVAAGEPVVGIAGGDGTLHSAAPALVGTDTALLCIPAGTLNHFARRHGIPDIDAAAEALRARRIRDVAVGTLQDSFFLNTLTFGEYSRTIRLRERIRRFTGKWPAALIATITVLATLRRMTVIMTVDGEEMTRRTPIVWIGLGWGSFPRVHEAPERRSHPDLEVTLPRSTTKAGATALLARLTREMLSGRAPLRDAQLEVLHAREITLVHGRYRADDRGAAPYTHRIDATADGEVLRLAPPVSVGVRDGALRVLVGPDQSGASEVTPVDD